MPTRFWFDERDTPNAANGDPAAVKKGLAGQIDARGELYEMFSPVPDNLFLPGDYALFMSGTTEELQGALTAAKKKKGLRSISVTKGQLAVWCIRSDVESIVSIAGRGAGPGHYWRMNDSQQPADLGRPASDWQVMFREHLLSQPQRISLDHLIDAILKGGKAPPLPPVSDEQVDIKTDVAAFAYQQLSRFRNDESHPGRIFTGWGAGDFCQLRTHDKVTTKTDQKTWDYIGDKVHVSVDSKQVGEAWNVVLPILIGNHRAIKDFKVTNMEKTKRYLSGLSDSDARRRFYYYYGAQITVYFRAAPGIEKDAAVDFARVMKLVSAALKNASIRTGDTPDGDLPGGDNYLSFRRDFNDLIGPPITNDSGTNRAIAWRRWACEGQLNEDQALPKFYISPTDADYAEHKVRMANRWLLMVLRGY